MKEFLSFRLGLKYCSLPLKDICRNVPNDVLQQYIPPHVLREYVPVDILEKIDAKALEVYTTQLLIPFLIFTSDPPCSTCVRVRARGP